MSQTQTRFITVPVEELQALVLGLAEAREEIIAVRHALAAAETRYGDVGHRLASLPGVLEACWVK